VHGDKAVARWTSWEWTEKQPERVLYLFSMMLALLASIFGAI